MAMPLTKAPRFRCTNASSLRLLKPRGSTLRGLTQTHSSPPSRGEGEASRYQIPAPRLSHSGQPPSPLTTNLSRPRPSITTSSSRPLTRLIHTPSTTKPTKPTPQRRLPASYYRGGTSRAPILHLSSLPESRSTWPPLFRTILGSPDPFGRQLNGLGGGISSLSKLCVVGPPTRKGADIDFTFVQMGIRDGVVDYAGSCGNMTAGVAAFAVDEGLVSLPEDEGEAVVRIHNTNTGKLVEATVPVIGGEAAAAGSFAISGVPGTGACIKLAFLDPAGSKTGMLLPTGRAVDMLDGVEATCIDASNPCVFVAARSMGVSGTILPREMGAHPDLLKRLESIRCQAAVRMGMCSKIEDTPAGVPKISLVSSPPAPTGEEGDAGGERVDIVVRAVSTGDPHGAVPISVGVSVAAAGGVEGSVVARVMRVGERRGEGVVVAHPSGRMVVDARFEGGRLERAVVFRTARRIMSGWVYV